MIKTYISLKKNMFILASSFGNEIIGSSLFWGECHCWFLNERFLIVFNTKNKTSALTSSI